MMLHRKHRYLQFSLRVALVAITVLCIALGVVAARVARQRAIVAEILRAGGRISYGHTLRTAAGETVREETLVPKWLRGLAGDDWFYSVKGVTLYDEGCNDETLKHVAKLSQLKSLALWASARPEDKVGRRGRPRAGVTDDGLRVLCGHPNVRHVSFLGNRVTDAGSEHLRQIPRLSSVQFDTWEENGGVSQGAYKELLNALEAREDGQ